jgi:hypothetical protein
MTELVDYIKPADRETYDYIFSSAFEMTQRYDQNTLLYEVGVMLMVIINQWERGELRDIATVSSALSVAQSYHTFLSWELETVTDELTEKFRELLEEAAASGEASN